VNPDTEQVGYHAQRVSEQQKTRAEALVRRMCDNPEPVLAALGLLPPPAVEPDMCRNGHARTAGNTRTRIKDGQESKECIDCEHVRRGREPRPDAEPRPGPVEGYCRNGHRRTDSNTRYEGTQVRCKDCRRDSDRRKRLQRRIVTES
jgi:hypothetical protein